jgi:hypothetical protein
MEYIGKEITSPATGKWKQLLETAGKAERQAQRSVAEQEPQIVMIMRKSSREYRRTRSD